MISRLFLPPAPQTTRDDRAMSPRIDTSASPLSSPTEPGFAGGARCGILEAPLVGLRQPWGVAAVSLGLALEGCALLQGVALVRVAEASAAEQAPPATWPWLGLVVGGLAPGILRPLQSMAVARWRAWARDAVVQDWTDAHTADVPGWLQAGGQRDALGWRVVHDLPWAAGESIDLTIEGARHLGLVLAHTGAAATSVGLGQACAAAALGSGMVWALARWAASWPPAAGDGRAQAFAESRRTFWDNLTLGNRVHAERWYAQLCAGHAAWRAEASAQAQAAGVLTGLSLWAAAAPAALDWLRAALPGGERGSAAMAARVAALAPLSLGALQSVAALPGWAVRVGRHRRACSQLNDAATPAGELDPLRHVGAELALRGPAGLVYLPAGTKSGPALAAALSQPGVYHLAGPVGSGKSMLAGWLKMQAPAHTYLMPATHRLFFGGAPGSSGELAERHLAALRSGLDDSCRLVVLDEPDANADGASRARLTQMVADMARRRPVLWISHRHRPAATP